MIEESPESFIARWREHAADVELFPRTEGSPLLEARAGGALVQLFERTGPYLGRPGPAKVIIHAVTDAVERLEGEAEPGIEVTGLSRFQACGRVVAAEGRVAVVDAGVPVVVGVLGHVGSPPRLGDTVRFTSRPPAHGFVVVADTPSVLRRREEHHDDAI